MPLPYLHFVKVLFDYRLIGDQVILIKIEIAIK